MRHRGTNQRSVAYASGSEKALPARNYGNAPLPRKAFAFGAARVDNRATRPHARMQPRPAQMAPPSPDPLDPRQLNRGRSASMPDGEAMQPYPQTRSTSRTGHVYVDVPRRSLRFLNTAAEELHKEGVPFVAGALTAGRPRP